MNLNHTSKENILVVDDTPDNLRLLSAMLSEQGYTVRKALNGQMALTASKTLLPDLILLDVMMPGMDGYQVCQKLKADDKTRGVPVIFISALNDVLDKVKAFDVGGVDYITKPFQLAEVLSRIENQLKVRSLQIKLQEKNILLEQTLSELKSAQVQLIQSEKMVAMGQLVAGIAHEINNPVNFIYGNLTYASQYIEDLVNLIEVYQEEFPNTTPKIKEMINNIDLNFLLDDAQNIMGAMHRGAERIQKIVVSLRNFSRVDEAEVKLVNIHEGIDSTIMMLEHRLKHTESRPAIQVIKDYGKLPLITCYASQINQVFMHLLNNAIDALELEYGEYTPPTPYTQDPTPWIRISTELTDFDTVRIRIADNGPGISESARSRLFDPFFTTKPVGSGMGLGLAISYQIVVQKHHGQLRCCSSRGQGAEFAIEIPVHQIMRSSFSGGY
ncbi:sensor histidine kinase [Argonema galeatum]|uniref:sensor histidine kinase n=1 Tax=Argonema galeatum TaxID=2942762 RepID=UPI00201331B5|nr:response regulator [Argonema galeatum]MCL1468338.1 response regulator [Argonema galeatum A003/A1]